ncbi:MAG: ABC transporter substrate-binding protein [Dehalococcoidia bacterium]
MRLSKRWMALCAISTLLVAMAFALSACSDDDDDDGGSSSGDLVSANVSCKDLGVTAPARIKSAGKLVVASDLSYAPMEFVKEGTNDPIGADVDFANCIAEAWGVKADVQNTSFDAIIAALKSSKADVIMSSMTASDERKKEIDFVEYFTAGSGILVKEGNPDKINTIADLCGKKVAIQVGTVQIDEADEQNAKCGDKKIEVQTFEQNTDTITAVSTGRAAAALMDFPVATYGASKVKGTEVVGQQYNTGNYGIAVRKDDGEVKTALEATVKAMMDKGKYDEILKYWGLEAGSIK